MVASTSSIRSSLLSSPKLSAPQLSGSVSSHCAILSIGDCKLDLPSLASPSISLRSAQNRSSISTSAVLVMEGAPQKTVSRVSTIVEVDLGNQSYPIYIGFVCSMNPIFSRVESLILPSREAYKDMVGHLEKPVRLSFDPYNRVLSIVNQLLVGF
uniref:3-dehydroquinate synthase, chloroplastic n=1 Tax=Elaeis guineensis var. tenera TaxID=51953 RepID=A0A6J0PFF9_ELAGV|nr:3-dehydroquinate synthase, chloroplastic [Elaeis guineensis]